jgi:hypothetical protein
MDNQPTLFCFLVKFSEGQQTILTAAAHSVEEAEEMTWERSCSEQWPICGREIIEVVAAKPE